MDLYRIQCMEELIQLGYEDYLYAPRGITFVEWAEKIEGVVFEYKKVIFKYKGLNKRGVSIAGTSRLHCNLENNEVFGN